jgi:hypothetical protein
MPDYLDSSDRILFHRILTKKRLVTPATGIRLIGFSGQRDPEKRYRQPICGYKKAGRYAAHPALGRIG